VKEKFVKILFDLKCKWEGIAPDYRIFVNDELFCERTYDLDNNHYLIEMLQVTTVPGVEYKVRLDKVGPQIGEFRFSNHRVEYSDSPVRIYKAKETTFRFRSE